MSTPLDIPLFVRVAYHSMIARDEQNEELASLRAIEPTSAQIQRIISNLEESLFDHPFNLLMPDPFIKSTTDSRVASLSLHSRAFLCPWIDPTGQWTNIRVGPQEPEKEGMEEISSIEVERMLVGADVLVGGMWCRKMPNYQLLPVALRNNIEFRSASIEVGTAHEALGLKLYRAISYTQSLEQAKRVFGMMSRLVGCTPFTTVLQPTDMSGKNVMLRQSHGMVTAVFIAKDHSVGVLQENMFLRTVGLVPYPKHVKGLPRGQLSAVRTKDGRSVFIRAIDQDPKNLRKKRLVRFNKTKTGRKKKRYLRLQDLVQIEPLQRARVEGKILLPFLRVLPTTKIEFGL